MISLPVYIARRVVYRIGEFLEHWYLGSFRIFGEAFLSSLRRADRVFAVRITLRHFFEPLYQDRTILGYILGVIFRTFRALIGGVFYLAFFAVAALLYLGWLALPVIVIYKAIETGAL